MNVFIYFVISLWLLSVSYVVLMYCVISLFRSAFRYFGFYLVGTCVVSLFR